MNKIIVLFDLLVVLLFLFIIIIPDWDKVPVTKDCFALIIIGEVGIDLLLRFKNSTSAKIESIKKNKNG